MKRCPSCQRTFPEDAPDFCPNDGMRLVKEESAAFDPERTMMTSGENASAAAQPPAPAPPPPQGQPYEQMPPPLQQWQPQEGNQFQQQAGWPPAPLPQQSATPAWGSPFQQQPVGASFEAPFTQPPSGRSRAIAIAALVFGVDAATIMALNVSRSRDFLRILLYALPIIALALGITSLFLALKKPTRFGGVELAIVALAFGVAGFVYVLMRGI